MREEAEILHSTLREITNAVKTDADSTARLLSSPGAPEIEIVDAGLLEAADDDFSKKPLSPSRAARMRSSSPTRSRSPAVSESALATVHSAIQKKNIQVMVSGNVVSSLKTTKARVLYELNKSTRRICETKKWNKYNFSLVLGVGFLVSISTRTILLISSGELLCSSSDGNRWLESRKEHSNVCVII